MPADYDKHARMFLDENLDTQETRDRIADMMGRRRPELDGNFFDAARLWEACGSEVDLEIQKEFGMCNVMGYLANSGTIYLVWGSALVDTVKLSPEGDLLLVRDFEDPNNWDIELDTGVPTGRLSSSKSFQSAVEVSDRLVEDEIMISGEHVDRLSNMLCASFAAKHFGEIEHAPTVRMTVTHDDEKVAILKCPQDDAPHAASNKSGPMLAITNAVKGAMHNINSAIDRTTSNSAVRKAAGATTAVAVVGTGMLAATVADMSMPGFGSQPKAQVIYDRDTGHVDFAVVDGNDITIMRDLGNRTSYANMTADTEDTYLSRLASNAADQVDALSTGHVVKGLHDVDEIQAAWRQKHDSDAYIELTLIAGDDAITVYHSGTEKVAQPVSQSAFLAEDAPIQKIDGSRSSVATDATVTGIFEKTADELAEIVDGKQSMTAEMAWQRWAELTGADARSAEELAQERALDADALSDDAVTKHQIRNLLGDVADEITPKEMEQYVGDGSARYMGQDVWSAGEAQEDRSNEEAEPDELRALMKF